MCRATYGAISEARLLEKSSPSSRKLAMAGPGRMMRMANSQQLRRKRALDLDITWWYSDVQAIRSDEGPVRFRNLRLCWIRCKANAIFNVDNFHETSV